MTLTNEDLLAISQLLDVKISSALQSELQPVRDDIRDLRNDMNAEFNNVYAKFDDIYAELNTINTNVQAINLHLENTTDKNIRILAENYVPAAKQYERAVPEIQAMKADIDIKNLLPHPFPSPI